MRENYVGQQNPTSKLVDEPTFTVVSPEVSITVAEIEAMPALQYQQMLNRQPGFAAAVDRAYAQRFAPPAPAPEPVAVVEVPAVIPDPPTA